MKHLILLIAALSCCSCATILTVSPDNDHIVIQHKGYKSYCNEIPRVYSGVSHNFCMLYGQPNRQNGLNAHSDITFLFVDSVFSLASDTVLLPYTIPAQIAKGNIKVN